MSTVQGIGRLRDYVQLQNELCFALMRKYPKAEYWETLADIPRNGSVDAQGHYWEFCKHGAGVLFTRVEDKAKVDVPKGIRNMPRGLDAWRLSTHFVSIGVNALDYRDQIYTSDDNGLARLFDALIEDGVLICHEYDDRVYTLAKVIPEE